MRRVMITLAVALGALAAATDSTAQTMVEVLAAAVDGMAQDRTFVLTGRFVRGGQQRWICGGAGNELPEAEIEKYWNEGMYITTAAYTADGWMICMTEDSRFYDQAYIYDKELSGDMIKKYYDKDYVITSISRGPTKFLVVFSDYLMYDDQVIKQGKWADMQVWYNSMYNEGYRTTAAAYTDGEWILVMTKDSPYTTQQFMMVDETKRADAVQKIWNEGSYVQLAEHGGGKFLVFYGEDDEEYGDNKQACKMEPNNLSTWMRERWDKGMYIRYIGGGNATAKAPQRATASTYTPTYTPSTTYIPTTSYDGGTASGNSRVNTPKRCTTCAGSGRCTASGSSGKFHCHGTGRCSQCSGKGYYLYNGHRVDCTTCNKRGVCKYCRGTGKCSRCNGRGTI